MESHLLPPAFYGGRGKENMNKDKDELHKDKECIFCTKFFECDGKPRGTRCINFEEEVKEDGMDKN